VSSLCGDGFSVVSVGPEVSENKFHHAVERSDAALFAQLIHVVMDWGRAGRMLPGLGHTGCFRSKQSVYGAGHIWLMAGPWLRT
jgi:hypothetical protein